MRYLFIPRHSPTTQLPSVKWCFLFVWHFSSLTTNIAHALCYRNCGSSVSSRESCHGPPLLPFLISRHQRTKETINENRSRELPKAMSMRFQNKSWALFYCTVTSKKGSLMDDKRLIFRKYQTKAQSFLHKVLQKY